MAGITLDTYPRIDEQEPFTVRLRRGYDIWLESGTVGKAYSESLLPAQWRKATLKSRQQAIGKD